MNILFFTDNFPPESNAPASRTYEHAVRWVAAGHRVTIVTGAPNFPQGKVYPGYRNKLWQTEEMDGIHVVRLWTYMAPNAGVIRRTFDFLSFMVIAMLAAPFLQRPDVIVGTSPQFFTLLAAWWASVVKRRPWVLELRDIWPESIKAVDIAGSSFFIHALQRLEMFLYRRATRIVAVTHSFKRVLAARGVSPEKIGVVTNGVDLSRYEPRDKDIDLLESLQLRDRFVVGYVGTHGMAHGLDTLLDAAERMQERGDLGHVVMLFVGDGARRAELADKASHRKLTNVRFIGPVPKDEVARYWSILDASIVHLRRTELFMTTLPSKIFECMGMGVPVLIGVEGEARELVERHEFGLAFVPEDADGLLDGIARMAGDQEYLGMLSAKALTAAPSYDRTTLAQAMLDEMEMAIQMAAGTAEPR